MHRLVQLVILPIVLTLWFILLAPGKEEAQLRRLLNENEEVARQRDGIRKRLELMQRAAAEIMNFRV